MFQVGFDHPDWKNGFEHDPEQAFRVRTGLFREVAQSGALLVVTHLPFPSVGRVAIDGDKFRYVPVVSEARPEDAWSGRSGFVHRAVMEDLPDLSGHQVYACGVPVMVDSARKDFVAQCRLPEDEFYADSFTTQADLAADEIK